ncbi:MAG: trypsin-like peptidase domain-containing protein, partial [Actinomycetia bacterium]|nr:trypsin-like peptidase domain-containing protein [Actinomycetes bacterium]
PIPDEAPVKPGPTTCGVIIIALLITLVFGTIVGGTAGFAGAWLATNNDSSNGSVTVIPAETDEPVSAAAAVALPSVVNIDVSGEVATEDSGDFPEGHPGVPRMGNGSGVAFAEAEDGGTYIVTNAHVVDEATTIMVTDSERERHVGEIVGSDPDSDIAVVKVDASIPILETGNSNDLIVGQLVVAIGSPYGLSHSVTSGVVSALGRSLPNSVAAPSGVYPLVDVIQTDAAINPGNSGGALVDRTGRLVGINSAIYSESGSSGGIGFAVPVNRVARAAEQLIATGEVDYPFLGVLGRDVDALLAEEEGLVVEEGAFIVEVTEGTEAEKAGVLAGDVIVKLGGEDILSMDDLILEVRRRSIGDVVTIVLYRDGEKMEIEMTVGIKPKDLDIRSDVPTDMETPEE